MLASYGMKPLGCDPQRIKGMSEKLEEALGAKKQSNQSMLKIVIGRTASMHGISVGKEMGNRFSDREAESRSTGTGEILLLIYGLAQVARKEMPAASPYPGHPLEVGYAVLPI